MPETRGNRSMSGAKSFGRLPSIVVLVRDREVQRSTKNVRLRMPVLAYIAIPNI